MKIFHPVDQPRMIPIFYEKTGVKLNVLISYPYLGRSAEKLTWLLMMTGIAFGIYGIGQWLFGLQELFGADPSTSGLRATGSFGNRNHYAAFMEMLLLCGVGWTGYRRSAGWGTP